MYAIIVSKPENGELSPASVSYTAGIPSTTNIHTVPLRVLSSHKRGGGGGQEWYQWIRLVYVHNRRCFLGSPKGLLSCFKIRKPVTAFRAKKCGVFFVVDFAKKKTLKRVMTSRYSPCIDTPLAATAPVTAVVIALLLF